MSILQLTPSRLGQLVESSPEGMLALKELKWLLVGGEALSVPLYERLQELTGTRVLNMYGPTEATIWSSSLELHGSAGLTIGRPLQHEYIYITDDRLQLCAVGITGEICIGGAGLARGYLGRPELSAEKFVPDPYRAGERLYRTGDLGRWLPDGTIAFAGRRDDQVKVRGYRIELGEIERALQSHSAVDAAVVLVKAAANGEPELVAYVVGAQALQAAALRAHLQRQLPVYMLPEHYVQLESFPLNASGKVDRKRLPAPGGLGLSAGREYLPPRNATEEKLVHIWEQILGRSGIGVKDNFFELGGHSLKATRLMGRLFREFGVKISLKDIFSAAVLEEQAQLIDSTHKENYTAIATLEDRPSYVLSSSQRRMWVLSQFEEGSVAYHMPGVYVIKGRLQPDLLTAAFNAVIARHEILRTVFNSDEEGEIRQFVLPPSGDFKILFKDVRSQGAGLPGLIDRFCNAPFDLAAGPLLRVAVYEIADETAVMSFVMHHIISDGWSLGVLIRELLQIYAQGTAAGLTSLPVQYKEYAAWQQAQLSGPALAAHRSWWLSQFEGELPVLELVPDKPRPAVKTYRGGLVNRQLDAAVGNLLSAQAQAAGCTLFMGLLAAVNALLYRYTRQEDIIIGSPVAGREHSDFEDQIGFYVNTLALRLRFSGNNSFQELLGIVREVTLQAYGHQVYPFDELVEDLQLQRDMSRHPLFDVVVLLQDAELAPALDHTQVNGISLHPYKERRNTASKFDLCFIFEPAGEQINLNIEYSSDIYNASTIERLGLHFEQLLTAMLAAPATAIKQLSCLTTEEEHRLLKGFNNTAVDYPSHKTLDALFVEQVAATPAKTALVFGSAAYSYKELDELSNRFANFLQQQCRIMPGDLVGVKLDRSEWLIVAILGILKAGSAYVPFDPVYPEDRIAFMLADTGCKLVIAAEELEMFRATAGCYSTFSPVSVQTAQSLAYIMYTSGSTGTPKGVMVSHRNIVRLVMSSGYADLTGQRVLLSTGAVSFDATTFEYWGMLLNGGKLVLCSQDELLDEQQMAKLINNHQVDIMWFTAGWLHQLIDKDITIFAGLKTIIAGGDKLSALHINRLRRHYPAMQVINGYGPTENTTFSLTYTVRTVMADIPLGHPVSNSTAYILDETLQLCPIGVVGEIVVGGDGLAQGYLNRDELTTEKFISNPYAPGERLYRTGDLGRWLPDGTIAFMGRRDDQVKIRGYRIELGEIEHIMQQHPGISAAVVTVNSAAGDKELAAYFTGEPGLDVVVIRAWLGKQLPSYMLPDHYVQLEVFPLTPNGKVDKKRLPAPQGLGLATGRQYVAPRNETEEKLVTIWEEILGRTGIGVKDDFFELGGHSLRATRLAGQLHKVFEVKVSLKELFATPVLEDQAAMLFSTHRTSSGGIMPAPEQGSYVLSSSQRRLWLLSQLEEGSIAYNIPSVYVFSGELKLSSLDHAFNELIRRHEILRTVFREDETGEVRQFIMPPDAAPARINCVDLRGADEQAQRVNDLVTTGTRQPFNLEEGPLVRLDLYQTDEKRWVFACTMHHIISDGWSMDILIRELLLMYNSHSQQELHELAPLDIQYKDYACWQQAQLEEGMLAADQVYWLLQFEGELPVLSLPTDYPRPAIRSYSSGVVCRQLPEDLVQALHQLCRQQGVTLFMALTGLVNVLLHRYTQQEDIIIGTPVAGREQAALMDQIGFYVNTLALRTRFDAGETYTALLERIREITLAAYEHQAYPLDELVEQLHLQRDISRNALFDVMLTLRQRDGAVVKPEHGLRGLQVHPYESGALEVSKFDITFEFIESGTALAVNIKYNSDLFLATTVAHMAGHLEQLLRAVTSHPGTAVNRLRYLDEAEETTLLTTFGSSSNSYDRTANIVSLFEAQVRKAPHHTALVFESRTLTYTALNAYANRLAHLLLQYHQQGADNMVGMLLDRSMEMLAGMLGILKSGAAYVPVDPEFPEARIAYLLQDSGIKVLLTQSRYLPLTAGFKGTVICLDDNGHIDDMPADNPAADLSPSSLAYLIYTSGSTGRPKGVMISHAALVDYTYGLLARTNIGECRSFGLVSTIAADLGNTVIYTSLLTGGCLHIYSSAAVMSGEELFASPVDCIKIVPSHWKALQQAGAVFAPQKCLIFGGEQLTADVLALLHNSRATCRVYNHYGPSETTIGKLLNPVSLTGAYGTIPLGSPFCNAFVCIVDPLLQLTGIGVVGEICIAGDGLSRGYFNRDELTAEKFIPNPFRPGERMYRTGDLGRWLPDGTIAFMGRNDDQVKIRGYRLELGEIAAAMQHHTDIDAAVVVARNNAVGEKELVGYFTGTTVADPGALRTYLAQHLPAYSVPAYFVQLEALPLTPNGKIDRKRLPVPEDFGLAGARQYVPPVTPAERLLAGAWEDVLNRRSIGIHDSFFDLGGHSLLAVKLVNRINSITGAGFKVKDVFTHTTIREMAMLINAVQPTDHLFIPVAAPAANYQLSTHQRRLWLSCQQHGNTVSYNIPGALLMEGPLNVAMLKDAYLLLRARHESLRTVLVNEEGMPRQQVLDAGAADFEIQEFNYMPDTASLNGLVKQESGIAFALYGRELVRVRIICFPDNRFLLLVVMHHIISDGWSMELFIREWITLYASLHQGRPAALPALPLQYKDYAVWQQEYMQSPAYAKAAGYWQQRLSGALPVLHLPFALARTAETGQEGDVFHFTLDDGLYTGLQQLAVAQQSTLFTVLFSAFNVLLHHVSGQQDIILGTSVAGRGHESLEKIIGFFVNTVAVRTNLDGGEEFVGLLSRTGAQLLQDFEHQDMPFEELVTHLQYERQPGVNPVFQARFVLNNEREEELSGLQALGIDVKAIGEREVSSKFDLSLVMRPGRHLSGIIEYKSRLYKQESIALLSAAYSELLREVVKQPRTPVSALDTFNTAYQQQLDTAKKAASDSLLKKLQTLQKK
ncbi:non-ribosomal peptide synthetase [Chitinophaga eiseniae]|uniref:non-ribosomal peptide synthetase n=1 Tax=Chitinophaga eiseniae TaxID=634771 RepID=UPI0021CD4905|nr:non-ribosomal peptide synthetase [Chitinophaga eiseniae]